MAYLPVKARSELVTPANCSGGGVSETTRRFHTASPASLSPARRPTLGSGFGAWADLPPTGAGPPGRVDELEPAQPIRKVRATTDGSGRNLTDVMRRSLQVFRRKAHRPEERTACAPFGRSRWSDRHSHRWRT